MNSLHKYILLLTLYLLASCSAEQESISYGKDNCHHCKMTISDNRYGSEMVTKKGKVYKFDSIECMAKYLHENAETDTHLLLVTDFNTPGKLLEVKEAYFLQSELMPSPMGMNLTAFADADAARQMASEKSGELISWETIQKTATSHGHAKH